MPAEARREPPSEARHGHGRPPDGPPDEGSWAFARGFRSLLGWPQQSAARPLPPLTSSGLRGMHEDGDQDGGVHRLAATSPGLTQANVVAQLKDSRDSAGAGPNQFEDSPSSSGEAAALTRPGAARPMRSQHGQSLDPFRVHTLFKPTLSNGGLACLNARQTLWEINMCATRNSIEKP